MAARGGAGVIDNAASGPAAGGARTLYETTAGGAGGASYGGAAGAGGTASAILDFDDTRNASPSGNLGGFTHAAGGTGGAGGGGGTGGAGGAGYAAVVLKGAGDVDAGATATGGGRYDQAAGGAAKAVTRTSAGGALHASTRATGAAGQYGGSAKALTFAMAAGAITAAADSYAGQSAAGAVAGHASAKTKTSGASGTFSAYSATSLASGQLVTSARGIASGAVDGAQSAKTKATIGDGAVAFESQGQAVALETGAPDAASTAAVMADNANIAAAFGPAPTYYALGELGGGYAKTGGTTSETTTDTIDLTVDLTQLASRQDLVVGFYNATALGSGFIGLTFTLSGDGQTLISKTFTTLAKAEAFFTDHARDLGSLATGALSSNTLTLQVSFTLTTANPGDGFYAQMIVGDPPATAHANAGDRQFIQAMAGLAGGSAGPLGGASVGQPTHPLMLAAGQVVRTG